MYTPKEMNLKLIKKYLKIFDGELVSAGMDDRTVDMVVVGGMYMVAVHKNRSYTKDIDGWIFNPDYTEEDYDVVHDVIRKVTKQHHLETDWCNDRIADLLMAAGEMPPCTPWEENTSFQVLRVYFPPADYILALKLLAVRDKDLKDITHLRRVCKIQMIQQARALINKYISEDVQQDYDIDAKLRKAFR